MSKYFIQVKGFQVYQNIFKNISDIQYFSHAKYVQYLGFMFNKIFWACLKFVRHAKKFQYSMLESKPKYFVHAWNISLCQRNDVATVLLGVAPPSACVAPTWAAGIRFIVEQFAEFTQTVLNVTWRNAQYHSGTLKALRLKHCQRHNGPRNWLRDFD